MKFFSTNNPSHLVTAREAVLRGLAPDGGLYMPEKIQDSRLDPMSLISAFFGDEVPADVLKKIVDETLNFPIPLVKVTDRISALELFHGPTCAFKDVGARFMARLLGYFVQEEKKEVTILVATSGDTGSAVAQGFFGVPGVRVVILYPSGKVSEMQEKQLTTMGGNITAIEVSGVFDDCQRLVKQAFLDNDLTSKFTLTSANSINIARWIPQSLYYLSLPSDVVISVPSGNLGNLAAGLLAHRMGAIKPSRFIAATNANSVVPEFLATGIFAPRPSIQTISNAMDVGNPSNFARIQSLYPNIDDLRHDVTGSIVSDDETRATMKKVFEETGYILDPHGAVAFTALSDYLKDHPTEHGVFLATAHPAKFAPVVESAIGQPLEIPSSLAECMKKEKHAIACSSEYEEFKSVLERIL